MVNRIDPKDKRKEAIHVLLTREEKEHVIALAARKNITLSGFVRGVLLASFGK